MPGTFYPCRITGCPELIGARGGYCPAHQRERRIEYDARRGKTAERGYNATWRYTRDAKLRQDPYCELQIHCEPNTPAEEVHHIVPISERPDMRLIMSNLQSACKSCHSAIGSSWRGGGKRAAEAEVRAK